VLPTALESLAPPPQDPSPLEHVDTGTDERADEGTEEGADEGAEEGGPDPTALRPLTEGEIRRMAAQALDAAGLLIGDAARRTYATGKPGVATALIDALDTLERRHLARAIVCAVDSEIDLPRIRLSFNSDRLKTMDKAVGFLPGEAAACVLLERIESVSQDGRRPASLLGCPSVANEEPNDDPSRPPMGRALSEAILEALAGAGVAETATGTAYLELNGETHRAIDWGNALVRLRTRSQLDAWNHVIPAVNFGDTGLASPVLALCLATRAYARGYATGDVSLILGSDQTGMRFAFVAGRP
jgi:3-oxoacyl-[acyl-carrier-protein] synthase-1